MIISQTPFRVSFFGGGTDYPSWLSQNEGFILSTTINKYCYITVRELPPFFDYNYRIRYYIKEETKKINQIKHPVIKNLFNIYKLKKNIDLVHHSDLPAMSGLGSSSSFSVGLINCLNHFTIQKQSKLDIALKAINLEQNILKENVGCQDQLAAAYGGLNLYKLKKNSNHSVIPINLKSSDKLKLENSCFLIFTGFTRNASNIAKDQISRINMNNNYLNSMNEITKEAYKIFDGNNFKLNDLFELLNEQWKIKQMLSKQILPSKINNIVNNLKDIGVSALKLLGAGGGGFILCMVNHKKRKTILSKIKKKYKVVEFKFDQEGSKIIFKTNGS